MLYKQIVIIKNKHQQIKYEPKLNKLENTEMHGVTRIKSNKFT